MNKTSTGFIFVFVALIGFGVAYYAANRPMATMPHDGGNLSATNQPVTAAVATDAVEITGYAFAPGNITVKAGTTVTWTNTDAVRHTVTIDAGAGPKSALFARGETFSYRFDKPGTYAYHCEPHPYMKATVTVTP